MYLETNASIPLVWYVHEAKDSIDGTYWQIFTTTTASAVGERYHSSGPISVPLVAGRHYAISVRTVYAISYLMHAGGQVAVSFGTMTGGAVIADPGAPAIVHDASGLPYYPQRLTTGP
jgi:hypothetical protein